MKYILLVFISILLSYNCTSSKTKNTKTETTKSTSVLNGTYIVKTLYNEDISAHHLTMNFNATNKVVSGFGGCNQYSSDYTTEKTSFTLGYPMATKIYCDKGTVEKLFFKAFSETKSRKINNNLLQFIDVNNNKVITASKSE